MKNKNLRIYLYSRLLRTCEDMDLIREIHSESTARKEKCPGHKWKYFRIKHAENGKIVSWTVGSYCIHCRGLRTGEP